MAKAIIFDVDGTLLDTERIYMDAWREAARVLGYDMPMSLLLRTRAISAKIAARMMEEEIGNGFSYEETRVVRFDIAEKLIEQEREALVKPGVLEVLDALKAAGVPMGIATSTKRTESDHHMALCGILDYFPAKATGDMIQRGKPNPDIFLKAAELIGADPKDCVVVEDSPAGIQAAAAAGMTTILIPDKAAITEEALRLTNIKLTSIQELLPLLPELFPECSFGNR